MKNILIIFLIILTNPAIATEEALFQTSKPQTINLTLSAPPQDLGFGFVRLAGIVKGGTFLAVIEVGGKGMLLKQRDLICGYRVQRISEKGVILCLKR